MFDRPLRLIRADAGPEVGPALADMAAAQAAGHWLAGYVSYEAGYATELRLAPLMPEGRRCPLVLMGVFGAPVAADAELARAAGLVREVGLSPPRPDWSRADHGRAMARLADLIAAGECYQVNLTMPLRARATGAALGLYAALAARQPVRHGAFVDIGTGPVILSRSPELFFRCDAEGRIEAMPMKGTTPRDPDPIRDEALRAGLGESLKNRAENLMIVDLLRNDIARIATVGSVRVPELYRLETYATVHQMVSRVTGQLLPGTDIAALFRALFPCGSVTGAPKIRAMEIIRALEATPRGVYCGSIGWAAPDGRAEFNVAIRTLSLFDGGEVVLNVGGGVVHDSTAAGEYEEALWKARFADLT